MNNAQEFGVFIQITTLVVWGAIIFILGIEMTLWAQEWLKSKKRKRDAPKHSD